jgi:RNA polymerase sigma factor (TIGR02999 family)
MRRVLVDRARARQADKRGAGLTVSLDDVRATTSDATPDVIALDLALERLAALDPRQARLVELRFFGGLTFDEAAVVLDVAAITLKRDWALARTWLYRELGGSS